jgi:tRNA(Ile)-lysidine synthase
LTCIHSKSVLNSESQLRHFRRENLRLLIQKKYRIVTGHHQDDLLETRLIRMIRGTGSQGLSAMSFFSKDFFRPLLYFSKKQLADYAAVRASSNASSNESSNESDEQKGDNHKRFRFVEDPSNREDITLRNWLRNQWLPALDHRVPGGSQNLAKSLERIVGIESHLDLEKIMGKIWIGDKLNISQYRSCVDSLKNSILASILLQFGIKNFSQGQIEEIKTRLDKPQKIQTFLIAGLLWSVKSGVVKVQYP